MRERPARIAPLCLFVVFGCFGAAGCRPAPPPKSVADVRAETLPSERSELAGLVDKWSDSHDRKTLENALIAADKLLALDARSYQGAWLAARACFWLADEAEGDNDRRAYFGRRGAAYADRAIALNPKGTEGHYYKALDRGYLAQTKSIGALDLIGNVAEEAKAAMASDEKFDDAGPLRLYGTLLVKAPGWPTSVGDPDEGMDTLKKAVTLAPDHPLNHFYYAEALLANNKKAEAEAELLTAQKLAAGDAKWIYLKARLDKEVVEDLKKARGK